MCNKYKANLDCWEGIADDHECVTITKQTWIVGIAGGREGAYISGRRQRDSCQWLGG